MIVYATSFRPVCKVIHLTYKKEKITIEKFSSTSSIAYLQLFHQPLLAIDQMIGNSSFGDIFNDILSIGPKFMRHVDVMYSDYAAKFHIHSLNGTKDTVTQICSFSVKCIVEGENGAWHDMFYIFIHTKQGTGHTFKCKRR